MTSNNIVDLPNEMLLKIFMYLPQEDLESRIQDVNPLWSLLAKDVLKTLIKFTYSPGFDITDQEIVEYLRKFPKVKAFHTMKFCDKDMVFSALIKYCKDLRSLHAHFVSNLSVKQFDKLITRFPNLESFKMQYPRRREIFVRIARFHNLRDLCITGKGLYQTPGWFRLIVDGCIALEHLRFQYIPHNDLIYVLEKMKNRLKSLHFGYQYSSTQIIELLGEFTKLEELNFHDSNGKSLNLQPLSKLNKLKTIGFRCYSSKSTKNSENFFSLILKNNYFPNLENLILMFLNQLYDSVNLQNIFEKYSGLKCLQILLRHPPGIGKELRNISKMSNLQELSITGSKDLQDDDVKYISRCRELRSLDLSSSFMLTDTVFEYLTMLSNLRSLNLSSCEFTGSSLHLLPSKLKSLVVLNVLQCRNLKKQYLIECTLKMQSLLVESQYN